jgi:hypothetical protein
MSGSSLRDIERLKPLQSGRRRHRRVIGHGFRGAATIEMSGTASRWWRAVM